MAAVTATDEFFRDPRFDALALHLDLLPEVVRMRCLELYAWQTEHYTAESPTYEVTAAVVVGKLRHLGAATAMVAAGLAAERPGGLLYIRGSRGRIEWLGERRTPVSKKAAGGLSRVAGARRDANGRLLPALSAAGDVAGDAGEAPTSTPPAFTSNADVAGTSNQQCHQHSPADQGSGIRDQGSEREGEGNQTPPLKLSEGEKTRRRRSSPKAVETPIPEDFAPGDAAAALAVELRLDLAREVAHWRDKAAASGWRYADHQAGLRTWLRNAATFRDRDRAARTPPAPGLFGRGEQGPADPGRRPVRLEVPYRRREPLSLEQVARAQAAAAAAKGGPA